MVFILILAPWIPMNNAKRRTVFAIRDFPKGCGPKVIPNPNPFPIESSSTANDVNVETTSKLKEEIRVSNLNDLENRRVETAQNGKLDPSRGAKLSGKVKEEPLDSEKNVNETVAGETWSDFKGFVVSQRRKVWAVRDFPVGCGRDAPKVGKGPVTLFESNAVDGKTEVGSLTKWKAESFEKAEDDELVRGTARETKGEAVGKALNVAGSIGEKKKPAKKPEGDVNRNESNRIQVKAKEGSREAKVKSPKVEGSVMVSSEVKRNDSEKIEHNAQESGSEVKPLSKNSSRENIVGEIREKKVEEHDGKQVGKNHHDKESRDARAPSGSKIANKVGRSMAGKPVDKGSISIPKDGKSIKKRKLLDDEGNECLEAYRDRLIVQALKSAENCPWRKDKGYISIPKYGKSIKKRKLPGDEWNERLEAYHDRLIVQALKSAENCPWRKVTKSGGIISRSFTPKTKTKKVTKFAGTSSASLHKNILYVEDDEDSL